MSKQSYVNYSQNQEERRVAIEYANKLQTDPVFRSKHLLQTAICKSVYTNTKCVHKNCAFAHTFAQLRPNRCPYGRFCNKLDTGCNRYHDNQDLDAYLARVAGNTSWPIEEKNEIDAIPVNAFTAPCNGRCGNMSGCFFAHDINQLKVDQICEDVECAFDCSKIHKNETKEEYANRRGFVFPSKLFVIRVDDGVDDEDTKIVSLSITQLEKMKNKNVKDVKNLKNAAKDVKDIQNIQERLARVIIESHQKNEIQDEMNEVCDSVDDEIEDYERRMNHIIYTIANEDEFTQDLEDLYQAIRSDEQEYNDAHDEFASEVERLYQIC